MAIMNEQQWLPVSWTGSRTFRGQGQESVFLLYTFKYFKYLNPMYVIYQRKKIENNTEKEKENQLLSGQQTGTLQRSFEQGQPG